MADENIEPTIEPDTPVESSPSADVEASPPVEGAVPTDDGGPGDASPKWPDNWQAMLAGDDKKKLAQLGRYATPDNLFDSWLSQSKKISSGELVGNKPDGDDEVAMNAWKVSMGIPNNPEGYYDNIPDGLVIGDDDKPIVDAFFKDAHAANQTPESVHMAVSWFKQHEQQVIEERSNADEDAVVKCQDEMIEEYGGNWSRYRNAVKGDLAMFGGEDFENFIMSARLSDGTPLGSNTEVMKYLVNAALARNPMATATISPAAGKTRGQTIQTELNALTAKQGDRTGPYWRGPEAESMQARWLELTQMQMDDEARG
jgi:hypothetical protein